MSTLSKSQLFMVQIFLLGSFTAHASGTPGTLPESLLNCALMMDVSIQALPIHVQDRVRQSVPSNSRVLKLITMDTFPSLVGYGAVKRTNGWFLRSPDGSQVVMPSDTLAKEVLAKTNVMSHSPREVMTVAAQNGLEITSFGDFTEGSRFMIPGSKVNDAFRTFLSKYRRTINPNFTGYVRMIHSHPTFDVVSSDPRKFHASTLSAEDMFKARELSLFEDVPVVIEAVSPNGYTYAAAFYQGVNITEYTTDKNPLSDRAQQDQTFTVTRVDHLPGELKNGKKTAPSPMYSPRGGMSGAGLL